MTPTSSNQAKNTLIEQKPLNKFYWTSEYGAACSRRFKSGDIWITYAWQDAYAIDAKALACQVAYMQPSQGRLGWFCGFMLGKDTKNYYHAHKYVESFINHQACVADDQPLLLRHARTPTIKPRRSRTRQLAKPLNIGDPNGHRRPPTCTCRAGSRARPQYELAWQEVQAA